MGQFIHFEIHADDPERAIRFYSATFGWSIKRWDGPVEYWLVSTCEGESRDDGGIVRRRGERPAMGAATNAYVCTMAVDSLDAAMKRVNANGGIIVVPKTDVPGVGWLAYAQDTEGNIFGIMQRC